MKFVFSIIVLIFSKNIHSQQFEDYRFLEKNVDSVKLFSIYYPSMTEIYELNSKNKNDYPRILTDAELKKSNEESAKLDSIIKKENYPHKIDSCKLNKIEIKKVVLTIKQTKKRAFIAL